MDTDTSTLQLAQLEYIHNDTALATQQLGVIVVLLFFAVVAISISAFFLGTNKRG